MASTQPRSEFACRGPHNLALSLKKLPRRDYIPQKFSFSPNASGIFPQRFAGFVKTTIATKSSGETRRKTVLKPPQDRLDHLPASKRSSVERSPHGPDNFLVNPDAPLNADGVFTQGLSAFFQISMASSICSSQCQYSERVC